MNEVTIFAAALEREDSADRTAFLDAACGRDGNLRRRVEGLLAAHGRAGNFLDRPAAGPVGPVEERTLTQAAGADPADGDDDVAEVASLFGPPGRPDSLGRLGHYEVLQVLGRGGFGVVFRAFDDTLQRVVAVKVLASRLSSTSPARKRFLREARASAALRHENVVQVYAVEELPVPYLVMEFIPGETLADRLRRTGPLDAAEVVRVGRQVAAGLVAAHAAGLIHRDIKPANILLEALPTPRAKITDFGLARAADDASLTQSGAVTGTPQYMSPEQARGDSIDHRSDLFSLGSVLYALLTGHPPFRAGGTLAVLRRVVEDDPRPIREVIPEVPDWLCRLVAKLLAKDPADRFATAAEVADVLAAGQAHLETHAPLPAALAAVGPRPTGRARRRLVALAAAGVLVALAASAYFASWPADKNGKVAGESTAFAAVKPPDPWVPPVIPTAAELADRPSAFDALRREDVSAAALAKAGGGDDPAQAPPGLVAVLPRHAGPALLVLGADGRHLLTVGGKNGDDATVLLTDLAGGKPDVTLGTGRYYSIALSPDGKWAAAGRGDGIDVWETATGARGAKLTGRAGASALAFSPDSARLASAGNVTVRMWDVASGRQLWAQDDHKLEGFNIALYAVAFSPDGRTLLSGGEDKHVFVRNPDTGERTATWDIKDVIRGLAFRPDGAAVAVTSHGPRAELRAADGASLGELPGGPLAPPGVNMHAMSPMWRADGKLLAWCEAESNMVRVCDLSGPEPRTRSFQGYRPRTDYLNNVALTADGRHVLTGNPDGSIYVIRLAARGQAFRVGPGD